MNEYQQLLMRLDPQDKFKRIPYEHMPLKNPGQSFNPNDAFSNSMESLATGIYNAPGTFADMLQSYFYAKTGARLPEGALEGIADRAVGSDLVNSEFTPQSGYQKLLSFGGEVLPEAAAGVG